MCRRCPEKKAALFQVLVPDPWAKIARQAGGDLWEVVTSSRNTDAKFGLMEGILFDGHTRSHLSGQDLAGIAARIGLARAYGRDVTDSELYYLRGLMERLESGYYRDEEGRVRERLLRSHLDLYVGRMRGSASQGFVDGSRPNELFKWTLGAAEDSCDDCPFFASQDPMPKAILPTVPGGGDTPCIGNCKCYLVRVSDGAASVGAL